MSEALAGLTTRGRAFLAAGLTAVVCAVLLGQGQLIRVGALATVLPLVASYAIARSRYRLALVRTVAPRMVTAGQAATVTLKLSNEGRTPSGALLLEDQVPYVLGTRPRFVVEGVGPGWEREVTYHVRSDVRGRFEIGPMSVRVSDPFGMVELGRSFHSTAPLTVTPRTVPLAQIPLGGAWTGAGDNRPRAFAIGSAEDVTVREYRQGDDLRRVHWRSSARVGELMVRREEQPWQSRATIFLDNRARAHRGHGIASSLETAVATAASVAVHLSRRGYAVRLVTAGGEETSHAWHAREADLNTSALLESLAVVHAVPQSRLTTEWLGESGHGGVMIAVLGSLDAVDVPIFRRMLTQANTALALSLDVAAWGGGLEPTTPASAHLAGQGWRLVTLRPGDRIESAWLDLARQSNRGAVRHDRPVMT